MAQSLKAGLVQMTSSRDVEDNLETASSLVREAACTGAAFVATPEMTTLVERDGTSALAAARSEEDDRALPAFRALARELSIHLLIGSIPIRLPSGRLANRSFLIAPEGEILARYDKVHLFDVTLGGGETYRESDTYAAGGEAVLADTPLAAFGMSVCYDLRFPYLYRLLARAGAQILLVPAAFTEMTGKAHWHALLRARAIETGCFVLAPAQTGHHADGRRTFGHSLIVDPWGVVLADGGEGIGVVTGEIDLGKVDEARSRVPALTHDRDLTLRRAARMFAAESRA